MTKEDILKKLTKNFQNSKIEIVDMTGQSNHFSILIISEQFKFLSLIKRHQIIYSIFEKELTNEIHALQLKTLTADEWISKK